MSRDAKGRDYPAWVRCIETIDAAGSLSGYKDNTDTDISFGIYCPEDATVTLTLIENSTAEEIVLLAGYHPMAVKSVTTTDVKIHALFAYKPD
jgi:hypothetical protein